MRMWVSIAAAILEFRSRRGIDVFSNDNYYPNKVVYRRVLEALKDQIPVYTTSAAQKVVEVAKRNGSKVSGPIPLPTDREVITILRAVHKYKDSREQFEMRTHKRLIDILDPQAKTVEALMSIELPAGVEIEIKA